MRVFTIALSVLLGLELGTRTIVEVLWFSEVGYLAVFLRRLLVQLGVGGLAFWVSWLVFQATLSRVEAETDAAPATRRVPLPGLLAIVLALTSGLGWLIWKVLEASFPFFTPLMPAMQARPPAVLARAIVEWPPGAIAAGIVLLLLAAMRVRTWSRSIALLLSLCFALVLVGHWAQFWQFVAGIPFERADPLFERDIGFYVFRLPVLELLQFWLLALSVAALLLACIGYLLSQDSFSQGRFPGFSTAQLRHLYVAAGAVLLSLSCGHAIACFKLLYSTRGVTYGASYADVTLQLPLEKICAVSAAAIAIWLWMRAGFGGENTTLRSRLRRRRHQLPWVGTPLLAIGLYGLILLADAIAPKALQQLQVTPNELELERPFIERSIEQTRAAFGIDTIATRFFNPEETLTPQDLRDNRRTLDNVRLWDARPLLLTNRLLQQIKTYYRFVDADVDRYTILTTTGATGIDTPTKRQQVLIAPRELDLSALPQKSQTWVNEHLAYTHGFGFTLSPVNEVDEGALPKYYVKGISPGGEADFGGLEVASSEIRNSIPIGKPRIYYGELTESYSFVRTEQPEIDFPLEQGEGNNAYNTYDGSGGIVVGSPLRRLLFAWHLRDWQMLLTSSFKSETKLLMRRTIVDRARAIAPFLRFDRDPYLVTADTGEGEENYLHWIIDAYTTSDRYPYSDPGEHPFNYIRNSVKIVVDAYSGKTRFYVADPSDPVVRTWARVFPDLFEPLEAMPLTLRSHIRYPVDLFEVRAERLLVYHMTDSQSFYNREDQWQIPDEKYGDRFERVEPYYLTMPLSPGATEEFVLMLPFAPIGRPNARAILVARSDGAFYGDQVLYEFPKQTAVNGPEIIENTIDGDPEISGQFTLWNEGGAQVIRGKLQAIPIAESLLYVEPVYLRAKSEPEAGRETLQRLVGTIAVYGNQNDPDPVLAPTFQEALQLLLSPNPQKQTVNFAPLNFEPPNLSTPATAAPDAGESLELE